MAFFGTDYSLQYQPYRGPYAPSQSGSVESPVSAGTPAASYSSYMMPMAGAGTPTNYLSGTGIGLDSLGQWQMPNQASSFVPYASAEAQSLGQSSVVGANLRDQTQTNLGMSNYVGMGLQGLQTLGNLWGAWQTNKLANKSFNFQKGMAERNLANQISSYNSRLEDHASALKGLNSWSDQQAADYVARNRLG